MKPRQYQLDLIEKAREELRAVQMRFTADGIKRKPRIMLQLGCGGGKSFIAALMTDAALRKGSRVSFIAHRDFLLEQISNTFQDNYIDHSFLAAGKTMDVGSKCHVGMVGSMPSRMDKIQPPSLAFLDEGHHGVSRTWKAIIDKWPDTTFILLSATPSNRSDGKGLEEICDGLVCGPSNRELIDMGALAEYSYFAPHKPDFSNVPVRAGEYAAAEAEAAMKSVIVGDIVRTYQEKAANTRAVYFATSIKLSKEYAAAFNAAGIPSRHLDKDSSPAERKQAAIDMAMGKLSIITCMSLVGEGFDIASQAGMPVVIDTVGLCFRTKSLQKLVQCMMRSMRAGAKGLILDHGGNLEELNFLPDDPIEWTLKGSKRNTADLVATYQCNGCGAVIRRGANVCLHCGTDNAQVIREIKRQQEILHIEGQLEKVNREARIKAEEEQKRQDKITRGRARTLEDLVKFGRDKGYKNPAVWAAHVFKSRMRAR